MELPTIAQCRRSDYLYPVPADVLSDYEVRPFSRNDFTAMQVLFRSAFGQSLSRSGFNRRYDTAPLGHPVIGFLAFHRASATPAAYYGVFPVRIRMGKETVLAAQSGDTMTHAEHRKKGLFLHLAERTLEACRRAGIALVFGQPNAQSLHGFIHRLRFDQPDKVVRYNWKRSRKVLPLHRFLPPALFRAWAKRVLKSELVSTPRDFTNLEHADEARVVRDEAYLAYKSGPDKCFLRIGEATFWIRLDRFLWIGDVQPFGALTDEVMQKLQGLAQRLGYNSISFHLSAAHPRPRFLQAFEPAEAEVSIIYYLDPRFRGINLLLTGADFDTW